MATQNAKSTSSSNKDEIEQIMNEIEQLQQEIDTAELPASVPAPAKATPAAARVTTPETEAVSSFPNEPAMLTAKTMAPSSDVSEDLQELGFGSGDSENSLEDTLGALDEEPSSGIGALDEIEMGNEEVVEEEEIAEPEETAMTTHAQMKDMDTANAGEGCLTMTLKGSMTLKLQYDFDGQVVTVGFSDGGLKISLADGTEFKIPLHGRRSGGQVRRIA